MEYYKFNKSILKYEKDNSFFKIALSLFCVGIAVGFAINDTKAIGGMYESTVVQLSSSDRRLSYKELYSKIKELNISNPDIVMSQAIVETGHFKSSIFIENNNLFGMKEAKNRPTTAIGQNNGHAVYENWEQSVMDYALYQSKYLSRFSEKEYLEYIKQNYAEDGRYVDTLLKVKNNLKKYI